MKIGLVDVDSKIPNLALMKISNYHKQIGNDVIWASPLERYDILYKSKVFTFTPDDRECWQSDMIHKGGTGYDLITNLPDEIDALQPDYDLYPSMPIDTAMGFLTRGCPNHCKWCVVPQKEGNVRAYMDIEQIASKQRNKVILMDNNILASEYGLQQIQKIADLRIKVDFNQALDARLVTPEIAKLLAKVKWIKRIRFGCDTTKQIEYCERAISLIDSYGYKGEYFLYCILINFQESFDRINYWKEKKIHRYIPHAQPYRDFNNKHQIIPQWQKDLARWTDRKELFQSINFKDYKPRKNFVCQKYFNI